MIDFSPEQLTVLMFGLLIVLVLLGYPLAFVLGGIGLGVGFLMMGPSMSEIAYLRMYGAITEYTFLAVPLFVLMGLMMERSGVSDGLFDALHLWLGRFRGGLAIATVLLGTLVAATVGVIAASVTMLGLIGMPAMLKHGYNKELAAGAVCAGGSLGILIPPSVMLVLYGPMASISVGKLFMAAFMPGFMLSALYCTYITIACLIKPELAPSAAEESRAVPFLKKTKMLVVSLFPPLILILAVLGSIFFGVAAPTEAAAVGALASMLMCIAYRKLTFSILWDALRGTARVAGMAFMVVIGASIFTAVFIKGGGTHVVSDLILGAPGGRWGAFFLVMVIAFILGMFIDWIGIILVMIPILAPVGLALGFEPLWFAMMLIVNLQLSFITPPLAYAIFFCQGTLTPEMEMDTGHIIRGVLPYIGLISIGLLLMIRFPQIALWLPGKMIS
jgi:tripartite ATP-independent transporter DctM subunit